MNPSSESQLDALRASTVPVGPLNEEYVLPQAGFLPTHSEEIDLDSFFTMAIAQQVSDIHLRIGQPPTFRRKGVITHTRLPALTPKAMERFTQWLAPEYIRPFINKRQDLDFSLTYRQARFRVNLLYELGNIGYVIRVIPAKIPTMDELGLPKDLQHFTKLENGLVLITGSTGSGKSTTLAAILNTINHTQAKHIITVEDPVEFIYESKRAIITQRQLRTDTPSFPEGVKYSLRQDPDVLLIGEMRDRETAMSAIKAAETGVLVFSTLHTTDAIQTINRIIDFFEPFEREAVRTQLANVLRGTVAQKLYRGLTDQRHAVCEILLMTSTVRDYLIKNEVDEIYQLMNEGRFEGMQTMNFALYQLVTAQRISPEEALRVSNNPNTLRQRLKGAYHGTTL